MIDHNVVIYNNISWIYLTVILPIVIGIFKKEILDFYRDIKIYRNRLFTDMISPEIGHTCYLLNEATGNFQKILISKYKFGFLSINRVIITKQINPNNTNEIIIVIYTYSQWFNLIKGKKEIS